MLASKIRVPALRPGTVSRAPLVNRLRATSSFPYLTVVAPAGYGKTTLLAQWAARDDRPFAWVTVDDHDNDATVFLAGVAAALARIADADAAALETLPALTAELAALEQPLVVVLDDAHLLYSRASLELVSAVADHLPDRSLLALAGRVAPRLPIARLRSSGRVLELGVDALALSVREADRLLRDAGVELEQPEVERLAAVTEGWPVGLYLAALARRDAESRDVRPAEEPRFGGDHRYVADYLRDEYLSQLTPQQLVFLRRTSILERMSAPLCDAVLDRTDSAVELQALGRANLFLVALDPRREWYRYHRLLRELLLRELVDHEPELVPELNGRAADWLEAHDEPEQALAPAEAAGDTDRFAGLVTATALRRLDAGRIIDVERSLAHFDDADLLERYPELAEVGCWLHALRGRPAAAERWLAAAERGDSAGGRLVLRAFLCRDGVEQMRRDAVAALAELSEDSRWRATALLLAGSADRLLGRDADAEISLKLAAESAESSGETIVAALVAVERALIASSRGDHPEAERLSLGALALVGEDPPPTVAGVVCLAAAARTLLRLGRTHEARVYLDRAERLAPILTSALPWLAVQTRLELAWAYVVLRDPAGARAALAGIDEIVAVRPSLGNLIAEREPIDRAIDEIPRVPGGSHAGITAAELRLLPLLATHLSFREIAEQVFVSRNTVKTQAISVYRKLGVSCRSDAIRRAGELGLLAFEPVQPRRDFIRPG
ncbi:MAG TPA: AAA family ATPase [Gaiellaceae bacterium]